MTRHPLQPFLLLTALLGIAAGMPARAQKMEGTLFTSPEQRAYMDFLRQDFLTRSAEAGFDIQVPEIPDIPAEDGASEAPEGPVEFTLGGIMTGRDGSHLVWLNSNLLQESELPAWARIVSAGTGLALQVDANGRRWLLRPGQTVDITSGTVSEAYQRQPPPEETAPPEGLAALVEAVVADVTDSSTLATEASPEAAPSAQAAVATAAATEDAAPDAAAALPERPLDELDLNELDALIESLQERRASLDED